MRRTSLFLILVLAVVAGACSDDGGQPIDPERLSLQIVSGDRQVAPVADAPDASQAALPAGISLQQLPDNLLPEPLVAQIAVDGKPLALVSSGVTGLSLATLPEDIVVTYRVVQPTGVGSRHCGDSFLSSAKPDKHGLVTTYWERGTLAGEECRMEVRLVVNGEPRVDTVFVAEFEPGPVHAFQLHHTDGEDVIVPNIVNPGDQYDMRRTVQQARDRHGNLIPSDRVHSLPDSEVAWSIVATDTTTGTGWTITVPPADTTGAHCQRHPPNQYSPNPPLECWSTVDLTLQGAKGSSNVRLRTVHP